MDSDVAVGIIMAWQGMGGAWHSRYLGGCRCSPGDYDCHEYEAANEEKAHDGGDDHDDELGLCEDAYVVEEVAAGLVPRDDPFCGKPDGLGGRCAQEPYGCCDHRSKAFDVVLHREDKTNTSSRYCNNTVATIAMRCRTEPLLKCKWVKKVGGSNWRGYGN